ncbi:hypothetical protein EYC80_001312 [Monilinia laxa]|uniref:Uncharacterized protein n=1 Tax=Monilinia laxa TaxID=61186 RepID=A0A5N6K8U6_MONLA|nr:hypothetical protein EYC80_001312 [Monilinia laxa]
MQTPNPRPGRLNSCSNAKLPRPTRENFAFPDYTTLHYTKLHYRFFDCIFLNLVAPSYTPRSTAAATVNVPPMMAQRPVKNPAKVLLRSSLLMTFIGEMS